mmetsp:Transcript_26639/g.56666  ORF Transcript_26639/g.56666 Transcript_26639/m.56666 type:complete len:119 (+) Transcript_26639:51-407(+)
MGRTRMQPLTKFTGNGRGTGHSQQRSRENPLRKSNSTLSRQAAKKFEEGMGCMKRREYELSEALFNEALRNWLFLRGANSELVLQCHSKLANLSCLQHEFEKAEYHFKAIRRIRSVTT